ncbi:MAG: ATP-binding protein [Bacteroidota bacterium]
MSLRVKYFLLIGIIHALLLFLSFQILKEQKLYFILAELGIIISFLLSIGLYRSFIRPLKFLYSGKDAIQDQDFTIKFVPTGAKEMDQLIDTYNNMIDRIREERRTMEEQHYFLQKIITASPSGILIFDYDNRLTSFNPKAKKLLDLQEEMLGEIAIPRLLQLVEIEAGNSEMITLEGARKYRCEVSEFVHRGFRRKFVMVQEVSKEILAAEKRAYGKVIRMMAHEVNNSIGAINSILYSLQDFEELKEEEWGRDILDALSIASERNVGLNQFMKNFADVIRLPEAQIERHSLSELCLKAGKLVQVQARASNINIEIRRPHKELFAHFDLYQLEQVLLNILKNAIESIEEKGSIQIILEEQSRRLQIRDNGKGIAPEVADQLFTPFFSTKTTGQGVGLTLIREILTQHKFPFSLQTKEDGWTVFEIVF